MAIRKTKPPVRDGIKYADGAGTETHDGIDYPEEHRTYDELARGGRAMARHHKESKAEEKREEEHKEHRKERAAGGSVKLARGGAAKDGRSNEQGEEGSGEPEYFGGGESPTAKVAKGDRAAKRGGRMKRKESKHGGRMEMEGKGAHHRLDRAAGGRARRAMGGKMTGSDSRPLTSASHLAAPKGDKRVPQDDPPTDDD